LTDVIGLEEQVALQLSGLTLQPPDMDPPAKGHSGNDGQ
jgi:hypothetical protein